MPESMSGVVLPGERQLEIRTFDIPTPGPYQIVLAMKASSICGSDLRAIYRPKDQGHGPEAYHGVIAGHEPCGVVHTVGESVTRFKPGDRVVAYHIVGCNRCHECREGWMISCTDASRAAYGWQRDGGHADFMLADEHTLVHLPEALTYLDGAMVACGFGTAYAACLRADVSGRDTVLITGLGPVGLGTALLCAAMGARVIGVEAIAERIELARALGVRDVLTPAEATAETIRTLNGGSGVEVAIDCSAHPDARVLCLDAAGQWGRVVYVGEGNTVSFEPSRSLIHKQLTLHGSWVCSIGQMEHLVDRLVRWDLHPEKIVTHRFELSEARQAYALFDGGQTGKVALTWS